MSMEDKVRALFDADRRLCLLRLLVEYKEAANSSTLEKAVRAFGFRVDRAAINGDIRWLASVGLVRSEELQPDLLKAKITDRGERVATGEENVQGVSRPSED